jgi:hypothetical protein
MHMNIGIKNCIYDLRNNVGKYSLKLKNLISFYKY